MFTYFAYGSNMLTERLQARCPSARPLSLAIAQGHSLQFFKRSIDRSGKATLVAASQPNSAVYGVLFEIARSERAALDDAEGLGSGYDCEDSFSLICAATGDERRAATYLAAQSATDPALQPYDWYRALVMAGAMQHNLPQEHIGSLQQIAANPDPNLQRRTRQEALTVLKAAGFEHLLTSPS